MITLEKRKVCLFLVPRTGVSTLRDLIFGRPMGRSLGIPGVGAHPNYTNLEPRITNFRGYKKFAFYRDPVERFVSAYNFIRERTTQDIGSLEKLLASPIYSDENGHRRVLFRPQVYWLDHPGITLLDFAQYEDRVRDVLAAFGVDQPATVDRSNESSSLWSPTEAERNQIVTLYADDYAFLGA